MVIRYNLAMEKIVCDEGGHKIDLSSVKIYDLQ